MSLLTIKNLSKFYKTSKNNSFQVLNDINLQFERGEIISIIGESGSGKSTLMNVIGGLDTDFNGEVNVVGKSLSKLKKNELEDYRKNNIGFIFQSFNLISHLSVLDNVTISMTISNVKKSERENKAKEILEDLGLIDHIHKKPNQLSGGQKQRVAIARALVNDPDIILADEPTGALDSETTDQVLKIISDISKKGKLVIMVTHSEKVAQMGTRIVKISDGKIIDNEVIKEHIKYDEKSDKKDLKNKNLSFLSSINLSLKNMKQKLSRNILVSLGSAIGLMSLILVLSVGKGVNKYIYDTMYKNINPLVVEVNKKTETEDSKTNFNNTTSPLKAGGEFNQEDIDKLNEIENVKSVEYGHSEVGTAITQITNNDNNILVDILKTAGPDIVKNQIKSGQTPKTGEIMLSYSSIKGLNISEDDAIGKEITIKITKYNKEMSTTLKISGIYDIDANGMSAFANIAYVNYDDLMNLYEKNGIDRVISIVYLIANDLSYIDSISQKVKDIGFEDSIAKQILSMFTEMLSVVSYILAAVSAVSLFVSSIMILVVLYISVVERTREIGVLKAIGARMKDIRRIFVSEAFLIGLFSGIIGVLEAWIISILINKVSFDMYSVNLTFITPEYIIFTIFISIIISVISGLLPSMKAAKLDPIESLRHE